MTSDSDILKSALEAKTSADFTALETTLASRGAAKWRPVGDMDDNFGAINAASDARLALNERITNMIDAILEKEARLQYGTDLSAMAGVMRSPLEAATVLLGVPAGGVGELSIPDRQKLADDIAIDFVESGVAERPTAVMRDRGIGQTPARLPETILSIHRGNKRDKPFLMGMYGWGGSNALGFAEGGTVIVSRRHPDLLDGETDGVAVTIVKKVYTAEMRTPAYFFAVDDQDDVLSLDVAAADALGLVYGTQITHIEYDLGIKGPLLNQYKYYNAALYEPVVPYYLGSNRDIDKTPGRRTMVGVGGALKSRGADDDSAKGTKVGYQNRATIDLGDDGEIKVHVWVIDKEGVKPGANTASAFVDADSAIVVTLNGQRQDSGKAEWIKRVCKYPHLYSRMIIEVEADFLSQDAKIRAFASTRERLRGAMHERIFKELAELLIKDEELQQFGGHRRRHGARHLPGAAVGAGDGGVGDRGQHLGHAALGVQDRGRVVDPAGQGRWHLAEAAGRALDVQVAADQDEFDLDQLTELDDLGRALGVTRGGEVALRALHDDGGQLSVDGEGEFRAGHPGHRRRRFRQHFGRGRRRGGRRSCRAAGRRAGAQQDKCKSECTGQCRSRVHRWIVSAGFCISRGPETVTSSLSARSNGPPRRGQGLAQQHRDRDGPHAAVAAEGLRASTAGFSAVDALCHSGRDGSAQPQNLPREDQVRVGHDVRVGLEQCLPATGHAVGRGDLREGVAGRHGVRAVRGAGRRGGRRGCRCAGGARVLVPAAIGAAVRRAVAGCSRRRAVRGRCRAAPNRCCYSPTAGTGPRRHRRRHTPRRPSPDRPGSFRQSRSAPHGRPDPPERRTAARRRRSTSTGRTADRRSSRSRC